MDVAGTSRLALAKALRESADGSSEAALRSSLSKSYYSIFHAAGVLLEGVTHENIVKKLEAIDSELGAEVKKLRQLRSQADYDPEFVEREFQGSRDQFRIEVRRRVDEGLSVFNPIVLEIEERFQERT